MVDGKADLGRDVVSARNVLEVMRPQIHAALCIGIAFAVGLAKDQHGLVESDDMPAIDAVFDGLRNDALTSVKDWAKDVGKVFDGEKLVTYIGDVLNECFDGPVSPAVAEVLAMDPQADAAVRRLHLALAASAPEGFVLLLP